MSVIQRLVCWVFGHQLVADPAPMTGAQTTYYDCVRCGASTTMPIHPRHGDMNISDEHGRYAVWLEDDGDVMSAVLEARGRERPPVRLDGGDDR